MSRVAYVCHLAVRALAALLGVPAVFQFRLAVRAHYAPPGRPLPVRRIRRPSVLTYLAVLGIAEVVVSLWLRRSPAASEMDVLFIAGSWALWMLTPVLLWSQRRDAYTPPTTGLEETDGFTPSAQKLIFLARFIASGCGSTTEPEHLFVSFVKFETALLGKLWPPRKSKRIAKSFVSECSGGSAEPEVSQRLWRVLRIALSSAQQQEGRLADTSDLLAALLIDNSITTALERQRIDVRASFDRLRHLRR